MPTVNTIYNSLSDKQKKLALEIANKYGTDCDCVDKVQLRRDVEKIIYTVKKPSKDERIEELVKKIEILLNKL